MFFKNHITKKTILAAALLFMGVLIVGCGKANSASFTVKMQEGYNHEIAVGSYAPMKLTITNNGEDFEGSVQMIIPVSNNENIMMEKPLSLPAGNSKELYIMAPVEVAYKKVNVRLADKRDKVLWEEKKLCSIMQIKDNVKIGILSDDFNALGYMDYQPLFGSGIITRIYELNDELLSEGWQALDMLDVIVISDYSTDLLTDTQLNALSMWVDRGGLIVVGTGSTANKTLSKLNNQLFNITAGDLTQYNTKFASEDADNYYSYFASIYGSTISSNYVEESIDDSEYLSFFYQYYEQNEDSLKESYYQDFTDEYYVYDISEDDWDSYYREMFIEYVKIRYYQEVYLPQQQEMEQKEETISGSEYVKADILPFEWDDATEIVGDTSGSDTYALAKFKNYGLGKILICSVDFTKNPMASYKNNSKVFTYLISCAFSEELSERISSYSTDNYYGGYYYTSAKEELVSQVSGAKMPPIAIYIAVLTLYIFAIPFVYMVLKKKKKTIVAWIAFPLTAAAFGLLIFCLGLSTRVFRPSLNTVTIMQQRDNIVCNRSITTVVIPKNKTYELGISSKNAMDVTQLMDTGSYYSSSDPDLTQYSLAICQEAGESKISLNGQAALSTTKFQSENVKNTQQMVDLQCFVNKSSKFDATVVNNYSCVLEDAFVCFNQYVYLIKDMQPGETVTLSDSNRVEIYNNNVTTTRKTLNEIVFHDDLFEKGMASTFGSLSKYYYEYYMKSSVLEYCQEVAINRNSNLNDSLFAVSTEYDDKSSYLYSSGNAYKQEVWFFAFPAEKQCEAIQEEKKYKERSLELLAIYYDQNTLIEHLAENADKQN